VSTLGLIAAIAWVILRWRSKLESRDCSITSWASDAGVAGVGSKVWSQIYPRTPNSVVAIGKDQPSACPTFVLRPLAQTKLGLMKEHQVDASWRRSSSEREPR